MCLHRVYSCGLQCAGPQRYGLSCVRVLARACGREHVLMCARARARGVIISAGVNVQVCMNAWARVGAWERVCEHVCARALCALCARAGVYNGIGTNL